MSTRDGDLNIMVEFTPEAAGEYSFYLIIKTNLGDFTVACNGFAEESSNGKAIYYESFEYDFINGWIIDDANDEDNKWVLSSNFPELLTIFKVNNYDGNNGLA